MVNDEENDEVSAAPKKSLMTLYSSEDGLESHRARLVLSEKGVTADIIEVSDDEHNEDLLALNPYHSIPTLVDRSLTLYNSRIIMEYLDERFPHPPLLPVYPVSRAKVRLMIDQIEKDWYPLGQIIQDYGESEKGAKAKQQLQESLLSVAPLFKESSYLMNDEFSLVDCSVLPLLWRLPIWGVELPGQEGQVIQDYANRLFERKTFQECLTETEEELNFDI